MKITKKENSLPLQKAFADYFNNGYYIPQLVALAMLIVAVITIDEFYEPLGAILIFTVCGLVIVVPFIFMLIWARDYKKGLIR